MVSGVKTGGDYELVNKFFANLDQRKANTKFNPPIPTAADAVFTNKKNGRGFIINDPMPLDVFGQDPAVANTPAPSADANPSTPAVDGNAFDPNSRLYGFRFLMNPPSFSEAYSSPSGVDSMQALKTIATVGGSPQFSISGASVNVSLFLSRIDDLRILRDYPTSWKDQYPEGTIDEEDAEQLRQRGTLYDMEYLFRTTNGRRTPVWWDTTPGGSSDFGFVLPFPMLFSFGDGPMVRRLRGFISGIQVEHILFAPGMVPMMTQLSLSIERIQDNLAKPVEWGKDDADVQQVNIPGEAPSASSADDNPATSPAKSIGSALWSIFSTPGRNARESGVWGVGGL